MCIRDRYTAYFEKLENGKKVNLKDLKSDQNAFMPIEVCDEKVYMTEPDGKLIQNIDNQQKCDFMIYCQNLPQTCFIELKGANISNKKDYNPYDQIIDTIKFIRQQEELKELVSANTERHAFIVSNGRQKIPKGIETKERALWQMLFQNGKNRRILAVSYTHLAVYKRQVIGGTAFGLTAQMPKEYLVPKSICDYSRQEVYYLDEEAAAKERANGSEVLYYMAVSYTHLSMEFWSGAYGKRKN